MIDVHLWQTFSNGTRTKVRTVQSGNIIQPYSLQISNQFTNDHRMVP